MPSIVSAPVTVAGLLDDLAAFGPAVEAGELSFERDPPAGLLPVIRVLHTGFGPPWPAAAVRPRKF